MKTTTINVIPCDNPNPKAQQAAKEFPERLKKISNDTIRIRAGAVYKGSNKRVDVVCVTCGREWFPEVRKLVIAGSGCVECKRQKQIQSAGKRRHRPTTPEEILQAQKMRESGMSYQAIGDEMGRSNQSIRTWCDPEQREKQRQRSAASRSRRKASGRDKALKKAYLQTPHGQANSRASEHRRRSLEFHARDIVFLPEHEDADYQGFVSYDLWNDYVKGDAVAQALFLFEGADEDVKRRKLQQDKLAKISGEPYSLEHLVPLSKNGVHHPFNFANRALALNLQKGNKRLAADEELFLKRLFDIS